jgi:hypothetical protein
MRGVYTRHEQIGLEDVVRGEDHVERRIEHFTERSRVEVIHQLSLEPHRNPLVDRARGGVHEQLPIHELVPLAVVGRRSDVRIVELTSGFGCHATALQKEP